MSLVVGGRITSDGPRVVDQGMPKEKVEAGMEAFVNWYNQSKISPLAKAVQGHLYFEGIHPFEDGNGRIGRILMQMSLSRDFKRETPLAISRSIGKNKELYYDHFESGLDITNAIKVMGKVLREAVSETKSIYELTYLRDTIENSGLNARQLKHERS